MRLKLSYERESGSTVDIAVKTDATATISDVAQRIFEADPGNRGRRVPSDLTLCVGAPGVEPDFLLNSASSVGEANLASGFSIRVTPAPPADESARVRAVLRVLDGPDAGATFELTGGTSFIGRAHDNEVGLTDVYVSKRHARVFIGDSVEVVDLGSANGLTVSGQQVTRWSPEDSPTFMIGDSVLGIDLLHEVKAQVDPRLSRVEHGALAVSRSPRVEDRFPFVEHEPPEVPKEQDKPPFPWLIMVVPVLAGSAVYYFTRNPLSLLFVAMSPLMMLANFMMTRQRSKRRAASEVGRFTAHLERLDAQLEASLALEAHVRRREMPEMSDLEGAVETFGDLLWCRRKEHWSFLNLRLGSARQRSRSTITRRPGVSDGILEYVDQLESLVERHRYVDNVPVVEDLRLSGSVGLVGSDEVAAGAARALLLQLASLHSPAEVVLAAIGDETWAEDLSWLKWLPHVSSSHSPIAGDHLADTAPGANALISSVEALIDRRRSELAEVLMRGPVVDGAAAVAAPGRLGETEVARQPPVTPSLVLFVADGTRADRARLVRLAELGPDVGVHLLWAAPTLGRIPAACRTHLDVTDGLDVARVGFVRLGSSVDHVHADSLSRVDATRLARALSAMVDDGAVVDDDTDLPRNIPLVSLIGSDRADSPGAVIERWAENDSLHDRGASSVRRRRKRASLRAVAGMSGADSLHLDLRLQGPHALVGGTTGSGKSEFLQTWVLGMASEYSPDRVTFLFVDYKGGAAFAECVELPHCVGLVTDLSPHLVRRSLTSLRAELHHRETLFNLHKVKDIVEFERSGDPACPPVLVIVIDEFAALANEMPEFVDGVVDIAQRGRSLGIHLIMATQRPAGVIRDNLRANTNLRVALRMADEGDSQDVLGSAAAAHFDPEIPGRAMVKTGPGRLTPFQSAYAGGWSEDGPVSASVDVFELRFGADVAWTAAEEGPNTPDQVEMGPTDLQRVVRSIERASELAGLPSPRRPWQPELSVAYDVEAFGPQTDDRLAFAMLDRPERQSQAPVAFLPDHDGNLAVYGTSGSGKTVVLRSLTVAAGLAMEQGGGPVVVYALDFGAGGLRMLEELPHVGSVIPGDDSERVIRLFRTLRDLAEARTVTFASASAGTITDFRSSSPSRSEEPRILLLIDNFPAFRAEYDGLAARNQWYAVFQQLLTDGRALGIHVIFTADRPASVPGSVGSSVPRRVVLRLTDEPMYVALDVPLDVLGSTSPPGRAIIGRHEAQVGVVGGSLNVADQAAAVRTMAERWRQVVPAAQPIRSLPVDVSLEALPETVDGQPTLGVSDDTLLPLGIPETGVLVIAGGPGAGRSTALRTILTSLHRHDDSREFWYFGNHRSELGRREDWTGGAVSPEEAVETAKSLLVHLQERDRRAVVVVESVTDFLQTSADGPLVALFKFLRRSEHLLLAENDISGWGSTWPLIAELKAGRRGLLLQPDPLDGEAVLKTPLPRGSRAEFPPGRGYLVVGGKLTKVQVANT